MFSSPWTGLSYGSVNLTAGPAKGIFWIPSRVPRWTCWIGVLRQNILKLHRPPVIIQIYRVHDIACHGLPRITCTSTFTFKYQFKSGIYAWSASPALPDCLMIRCIIFISQGWGMYAIKITFLVVLLALTITLHKLTSRSPFPCAISIDSKPIASGPWNELLRS